MNGRKKYKGELYSFFRSERNIGSGGNGAVYDVEFEGDEGFEFPIVAKFFEYGGVDKEKRYNRFKNEIIALNALKGIEGIMEVIDKQCPHVVPQTKDEAWYLMPKAKPYKLNRKRNIYSKILEMLQLARIIQSIHERDKAHRDIKPENILVLNGKLVLSDFGLCWGIGEERLTGLNERVGPYKIMPPELERVQTDLDLDFKPSDVYLFSNVLWMTLKGDNIGFRGQYQRGEVQIYLNKEDYDNVITLEPIHKLMEEATFEEMGKRISIQKCIEYLELQRKILNREEYELLSNEFVSQLLYDEYSKKIIACSKPDELTYKDAAIITHMLRDIIPISNIFVKSLHSDQNIKHYHSKNEEYLNEIITKENTKELCSFYDSIGIVPKIKDGYYYPYSNMAISIKNALVTEVLKSNIKVICNYDVKSVDYKNNEFTINNDKHFDKIIISTGSKAYPKTGSDGFGYSLVKKLGHTINEVKPALVSLCSDDKILNIISGVRANAKISLYHFDELLKEEIGEVQFVKNEVSGICTFNLSYLVTKNNNVRINFMPFIKVEE